VVVFGVRDVAMWCPGALVPVSCGVAAQGCLVCLVRGACDCGYGCEPPPFPPSERGSPALPPCIWLHDAKKEKQTKAEAEQAMPFNKQPAPFFLAPAPQPVPPRTPGLYFVCIVLRYLLESPTLPIVHPPTTSSC
jgi:hypothetical protein